MAEEPENNLTEKSTESGSYPADTLEESIELAKQIYDAKGDAFVSLTDIAVIAGKAKGTMIMRISACVQYGLLKNVYKKGYHITALLLSIIGPEYSHMERIHQLEAFNNPKLYKRLIDRYNGQMLPSVQGLANILSTFGIHENSKLKAANVFLENCKDLKIIEQGRLRYIITKNNGGNGNEDEDKLPPDDNGDKNKNPNPPEKENPELFKLAIDLGDRNAYLQYPRDISSDEIAALKIWLDASLKALELRQKKNESGG